jgi:ABC-type iron transport system FetAB permease component
VGALIHIAVILVVLVVVGLVLAGVHFIALGAAAVAVVVGTVTGVLGTIFDLPEPWVILASVAAFGMVVVVYLIDKRKKAGINNQPGSA